MKEQIMTKKISADNYFCIIPEWVLYSDITATAVRLYGTLQRYADKDSGECHPSRATLAQRCNCTTKSIDRALAELIAVGAVLKKQRVAANGDLTSNQYTVITVAGVGTKLSLPRDKKDPTGRDKNDLGTRVSMNQSHEPNNAKSIAEEWWQQYKQRTDGKSPVGKGAWHSLMAVVNAALNAGWEPEQVRTAIMACTVPSSAQLDRELNKTTSGVVQPVQASKQQVRHIPAITGDKACEACSGTGVMVVFDDEADQWKSIKCDCYTETYAY
jgi:hypothetical protein